MACSTAALSSTLWLTPPPLARADTELLSSTASATARLLLLLLVALLLLLGLTANFQGRLLAMPSMTTGWGEGARRPLPRCCE